MALEKAKLAHINIHQIVPDADQVRRDMPDIPELAANLKEVGLLVPLQVYLMGTEQYMLLDGHRRLAAAKIAGLTQMTCLILSTDPHERDQQRKSVMLKQLSINLTSQKLHPFDIADALEALQKMGLKQEQIGRSCGITRTNANEYLTLCRIPKSQRKRLWDLKFHVLLRIARASDDQRDALVERALKGGTVAELKNGAADNLTKQQRASLKRFQRDMITYSVELLDPDLVRILFRNYVRYLTTDEIEESGLHGFAFPGGKFVGLDIYAGDFFEEEDTDLAMELAATMARSEKVP